MNSVKELKQYDEYTCPEYLYPAWRVLFTKWNPPNKVEILRQATFDLQEDEDMRKQRVFNRDRFHKEGIELRKYNW